jgi:hypothetical protein
MTRRAIGLLVVCLASSFTRSAGAQSAADKAAAEVLFEEGKALMQNKQYAVACPKLLESNRLDAGLGTVLWLADCYEKNGQTASAWAEFREAADIAARAHDPRERVARERADRLQPTLSKLTILAGGTAATPATPAWVVTRDADEVGKGQWGVAVPVDPGPHTVTVTAPHKRTWEKSVFVPAGVNIDVALPLALETVPEPALHATAAPQATRTARTKSEEPERSGEGGAQRALGGALIGLGAAGLAAGGVLAVLATISLQDSTDTCGGHCASEASQDAVQGHSETTGSIVSFVGGGALLLTGIVVVVTAPSGNPHPGAKSGSVRVLPWVGPTGGGLGLGAAFE